MKRVYIARGSAEAHLIRAFLENDGIEAVVRGEDLSAVFGGIPIDGDSLPSVWVLDDADYDRALGLVKQSLRDSEADRGETAAGPDWHCPRCGETVDGGLFICWSCSTARDEES